ncbi:MAG: imidazole glycerol phosphate synthase subunit HisF [Myxococcales bacterium]|nr:imidazole glycerol phosphate synthase subunit HisF [Myxococcales bacterium]
MTPIPIPTPVIPIIPIIPVLPIRGGRVEPLPGITTLRDPAAPVELARYLDAHGAARLMIEFHDELARLDELLPLLERITAAVRCPTLVSVDDGSLRDTDDVDRLLDAGAQRVALNTAAVRRPEWVSEITARHGPDRALAIIRARRVTADWWEPMIHGGQEPTGLDAISWAFELVERGVGELLVHSLDKAGHGWGYDLELTRAVADTARVPVIASGGAALPQDLVAGLTKGHARAVVVDEMVHTGRCALEQIRRFVDAWLQSNPTAARA